MPVKKFEVNSPANPYNVFANTQQNLAFTIEFTGSTFPASVILQYDIDDSGKSEGVQFSQGGTSFKQSVGTPGQLNNNIQGSFILTNGNNNILFGISISILGDSVQSPNINIFYSNKQTALSLHPQVEAVLMKKLKLEIKRGLEKHLQQNKSKKRQ